MGRHKEFDQKQGLQTARNLFWNKGYHATSMNDLVSEMKVCRSSLYETYGDKHQLFLKSLNDYALDTHNEYQKAAAGISSPIDAIKAIIQKAIDRSFEKEKVCMSVKSSFELSPADPIVQKTLQTQVNNLAAIFEKLISSAQQKNEISATKNANQLAYFIVASFAGFWQMQTLFNNKQMVLNMAEILMESIN
jgi:TetR/AcrR family transcriptional regulator, transcriptional repressor for nem operon